MPSPWGEGKGEGKTDMSGWLNTPVLISEGSRVYPEYQTYIGLSIYSRKRKITLAFERYVGGDKTAADAKATVLAGDASYSDVAVQLAGGGQYHVVATKKTIGAWEAWSEGVAPT